MLGHLNKPNKYNRCIVSSSEMTTFALNENLNS